MRGQRSRHVLGLAAAATAVAVWSGTAPPVASAPPVTPVPRTVASSFSVDDVTKDEGDSGITEFVFQVTRSGITTGVASVKVATVDKGAKTGDGDYTAVPSTTLSFAAGVTTRSVTVQVKGDTKHETNETFWLSLSSPSASSTIVDGTGLGTIRNDDAEPTISIGDATRDPEGSGGGFADLVFTVTLSRETVDEVQVLYSTVAATGEGAATANADYTPRVDQLFVIKPWVYAYRAGMPTGQIRIPIAKDAIPEPTETFTVQLSTPVNATIADGTATGTIVDDDGAPPPSPTLFAGDVTADEGTTIDVPVSMLPSSATNVTVQYATAGGTAASGTDFTPTSGTLTIPAGATAASVPVVVLADSVVEQPERFTLTLSSPNGATISDASATVTIAAECTIVGTDGHDVLNGTDGDDVICALGGGDTIRPQGGNDIVKAGDGVDSVWYDQAPRGVQVDLDKTPRGWDGPRFGTATGWGTDQLFSVENVQGSAYADFLTGDSGPNQLAGLAGNDVLSGEGGQNHLQCGDGTSDTASWASAGQAMRIDLSAGQAKVRATGVLADSVGGCENVIGSRYNDRINGTPSTNVIAGGSGDDDLYGAYGDDTLVGEAGDDVLLPGGGIDTVLGGAGTDTAQFTDSPYGITADITEGGAPWYADGHGKDTFTAVERIIGSAWEDHLSGSSLPDWIRGMQGDDYLWGSGGDDELFGDQDDDEMIGGSENDTLLGGSGGDIINGNSGDDVLEGGYSPTLDWRDTLNGGTGIDTCRAGGGTYDDVRSGCEAR